jgi:hypothetical protein
MFQRACTAAGVLPGNLQKIHFQDLPSFLYAIGAARLRLTIGSACSCANVPTRPRLNICHRRCWDQNRCRSNHRRHRCWTAYSCRCSCIGIHGLAILGMRKLSNQALYFKPKSNVSHIWLASDVNLALIPPAPRYHSIHTPGTYTTTLPRDHTMLKP